MRFFTFVTTEGAVSEPEFYTSGLIKGRTNAAFKIGGKYETDNKI